MINYVVVITFLGNLTDLMDPFELDKEFQMYLSLTQQQLTRRWLLSRVLPTPPRQHRPHHPDEGTHRGEKPADHPPAEVRGKTHPTQDDEFVSQSDRQNEKGKRMRRNADEIERYYKCSVKACSKSYGSEGSLNQHYKLKHP